MGRIGSAGARGGWRGWLFAAGLGGGALLLGGLVAWAQGELTVIEMRSAIRKEKKSYAARIAELEEGNKLDLLATEDPWLRVQGKGVTGWILKSAVTDRPNPVLSGTAAARGTTATNISAASRGFNPAVEREYRAENPGLEDAYRLLDAWVEKPLPEEDVIAFLRAGKLLVEAN